MWISYIEKKYETVDILKHSLTKLPGKWKKQINIATVFKTKSTSHLLRKVLLSSTWNHHFQNMDLSKWKRFDRSPLIASLSSLTLELLFFYPKLRNVQFSRGWDCFHNQQPSIQNDSRTEKILTYATKKFSKELTLWKTPESEWQVLATPPSYSFRKKVLPPTGRIWN